MGTTENNENMEEFDTVTLEVRSSWRATCSSPV